MKLLQASLLPNYGFSLGVNLSGSAFFLMKIQFSSLLRSALSGTLKCLSSFWLGTQRFRILHRFALACQESACDGNSQTETAWFLRFCSVSGQNLHSSTDWMFNSLRSYCLLTNSLGLSFSTDHSIINDLLSAGLLALVSSETKVILAGDRKKLKLVCLIKDFISVIELPLLKFLASIRFTDGNYARRQRFLKQRLAVSVLLHYLFSLRLSSKFVEALCYPC